MHAEEAQAAADYAYRHGQNIFVYDMTPGIFSDMGTEWGQGIEAIERQGFELVTVANRNDGGRMWGVFRRRDDFRTQE